MSGSLYLHEWGAAKQRSNNSTPDLFAARHFAIFGIRRALTKLGATPIIDLEALDAREVERMRVEIVAQFRRETASAANGLRGTISS